MAIRMLLTERNLTKEQGCYPNSATLSPKTQLFKIYSVARRKAVWASAPGTIMRPSHHKGGSRQSWLWHPQHCTAAKVIHRWEHLFLHRDTIWRTKGWPKTLDLGSWTDSWTFGLTVSYHLDCLFEMAFHLDLKLSEVDALRHHPITASAQANIPHRSVTRCVFCCHNRYLHLLTMQLFMWSFTWLNRCKGPENIKLWLAVIFWSKHIATVFN